VNYAARFRPNALYTTAALLLVSVAPLAFANPAAGQTSPLDPSVYIAPRSKPMVLLPRDVEPPSALDTKPDKPVKVGFKGVVGDTGRMRNIELTGTDGNRSVESLMRQALERWVFAAAFNEECKIVDKEVSGSATLDFSQKKIATWDLDNATVVYPEPKHLQNFYDIKLDGSVNEPSVAEPSKQQRRFLTMGKIEFPAALARAGVRRGSATMLSRVDSAGNAVATAFTSSTHKGFVTKKNIDEMLKTKYLPEYAKNFGTPHFCVEYSMRFRIED
jgi:hypothetical protein